MSEQVQGLQLFNANETQGQAIDLDGKGPYAGGKYKATIFTPNHHKTNTEGGESTFAGSGYAVFATIIGLTKDQAEHLFPASTNGSELKVTEYTQQNGEMVETAHADFKGVQIVKRSFTEATMPIEGGKSLPYVSFQFTYVAQGSSYNKVGGTAYHLTPNFGAAPAGVPGMIY